VIPLIDNIPTRRFPAVTVALIGLNAAVYLNQLALGARGFQRFIYLYGLIPFELTQGVLLVPHPVDPTLTVLTSMFVHAGFFHLLSNMWFLWIFGNNVEDGMGRARFVAFYLLCGLAAALAQVLVHPTARVPMVGASGAVAGVLGAYLLLHPEARVRTLVTLGWFWTIAEIPALVVLGFWIVGQVVNGLVSLTDWVGGGVAWFAHIGGFAAGMALIHLFRRRPRHRWGRGFG
jgi:membrane associated rhomboid family serine protease